MSLEIILIDNSQHVEKTLHYFLRQYTPNIHHFQNKDELSHRDKNTPPDVVFIDVEQVPHVQPKIEFQNSQTPVVLLYKQDASLQNTDPSSYQEKLKKPLNPKEVQSIIQKLIPKTQKLKISPFLKFYSKEDHLLDSSPPHMTDQTPQDPSSPIPIEDMNEKPSNPSQQLNEKNTDTLEPITPPSQQDSPQSAIPLSSGEPVIKKPDTSQETSLQNKENLQPASSPKSDTEPQKKSTFTSTIKSVLKSANKDIQLFSSKTQPSVKVPKESPLQEPSSKKPIEENSLQKNIHEMLEQKFQKEWKSAITTQLQKEIQTQIKSEIDKMFIKHIKNSLQENVVKIIKKTTTDILWKILPDISKNIIEKEIQKIHKKDPSNS